VWTAYRFTPNLESFTARRVSSPLHLTTTVSQLCTIPTTTASVCGIPSRSDGPIQMTTANASDETSRCALVVACSVLFCVLMVHRCLHWASRRNVLLSPSTVLSVSNLQRTGHRYRYGFYEYHAWLYSASPSLSIATFKSFAGFSFQKPIGLWIICVLRPLVCAVLYIISQLIPSSAMQALETYRPLLCNSTLLGTTFIMNFSDNAMAIERDDWHKLCGLEPSNARTSLLGRSALSSLLPSPLPGFQRPGSLQSLTPIQVMIAK
jgi:hypothetical protein